MPSSQAARAARNAEGPRKRPFITVGFAAFCLLVPLAITTSRRMVARLGSARWRRLHRLMYPAAMLL